MDKKELWGDLSLDPCRAVFLYQVGKGNEEKPSEILVSMLMAAARVGRAIASAVLRMYKPGPI